MISCEEYQSENRSFIGTVKVSIAQIFCKESEVQTDWAQASEIKSLMLEAIPSATQFFKRAYKISHFPGLKASWVDLPSFATSSKICPNFSKKVV